MTYKEIINRIRTVASQHLMIKDFGYGELSDIKTQAQFGPSGNIDDGKEADYPYMFLLPSGSTRNDPVVNYNFSMIMMDMARGEEGDTYDNYLTIQSQCQQYIDDVLANLYYYYRDQPMVQLTGITYTPFKEKYQDEVAGMTCNFTIEVPNGLNQCIAPFGDLVEWWSEDQQYIGGNATDAAGNFPPYTPENINGILYADTPEFNDGNPNWKPQDPSIGGTFKYTKTYSKLEITFDYTPTWDPVIYSVANGDPYDQAPPYFRYAGFAVPQPDPVFDNNNTIVITGLAGDPIQYADSTIGWPDPAVSIPPVGTTYPVTMTWDNVTVLAGSRIRQIASMYTYPASPTPNVSFANNVPQYNMQNLNIKLFV